MLEQPDIVISPEAINALPRVESYEEFLSENQKLERFIDEVEENAPNGEVDVFSADFWIYYEKFIKKYWEEKYMPIVNRSGKDSSQVMDFVFSGGSRCFRANEHLSRLKQRTLLNAAKKELNLDPESLNLIKQCLPIYYRPESGYGQKKVSREVVEIYLQKLETAKEQIKSHPSFPQIQELNKKFKIFNALYKGVCSKFMYYASSSKRGKEIADRHGRDWSRQMLRELVESLKEEYDIEGDEDLMLSGKDRIFLNSDSDTTRRIIDAACEAVFVRNDKIISKIWGDADGYSSTFLQLAPIQEDERRYILSNEELK